LHRSEHKFLLSDNRHYTFYIWKLLFRRDPLLRYAYVPVYWFSGWRLWQALVSRQKDVLWCAGYVLATALVLVPSPLLEFRYFIVPYLLLRVHLRPSSSPYVWLELLVHTAINVVTLFLFLYRPFLDPQTKQLQHFMW